MAPHTGVNYRGKREGRETWERLSLSLSRQEKKKKTYEFLRRVLLLTEKFLLELVGNIFFLGGQKILVGYYGTIE